MVKLRLTALIILQNTVCHFDRRLSSCNYKLFLDSNKNFQHVYILGKDPEDPNYHENKIRPKFFKRTWKKHNV